MKIIFFIKILLILVINMISGNKYESNKFTPTLPEATQIGANIFGCYVDGKLLTPSDV